MFSWFDASEAIAQGQAMAQLLIKAVPPAQAALGDKASPKQKKALELIYHQIEQTSAKTKLNPYKKARMAKAFQEALLVAGYEGEYVMAVTKRVVMKTAYGKEQF